MWRPILNGAIKSMGAASSLMIFFVGSHLRAEALPHELRIEAAAAMYSSADSRSLLETIAVEESTHKLRLGVSRRHPLGTPSTDSTLGGNETGFTLSGIIRGPAGENSVPDFTVAPRVGWLGSDTGSRASISRWLGTGISFWTGEETMRWTLDIQRTLTATDSLDVTDVDGKRILTPERIGGTSTSVSWMHLATPEFIWLGNLTAILREDRPDAFSGNIEGRYFVAPANAAIQGSLARFEDSGTVKPVTITGSITATTTSIEWHQKYGTRMIIAPGYRWYRETETPRAENGVQKNLASDQVYATLRYRFWQDYWLEDASEIFLSAGSYSTQTTGGANKSQQIWHIAAGATLGHL